MERRQAMELPLGARARAIYRDYRLFKRANYPPNRFALYPGVKQLVLLVAILWLGFRLGPSVRQVSGRSLMRQFLDLVTLAYREGIDPVTYYLQELYRPEMRGLAPYFLTRYETKNGLLSALNNMRPRYYPRSELADKLLFADCCERFGIPTPPILLSVERGRITWRDIGRAALDRDLFAKPRSGKGARDACFYRRIGPERYLTSGGSALSLDELMARLVEQSHTTPMLLQPRLQNHPSLADLASDSLIVIRVFTCLDQHGVPEATHAMLRILAKLEPTWTTKEEFAAPIDLATGEFGLLAGDKLETALFRYKVHPVTGAPILGRKFEGWPAVRDLAVAAHKHFSNRIVIGWDVALTEHGPIILEGNNVPDVAFPQRVHRCPMGKSRLGELLQCHLTELCAAKDAERNRRRSTWRLHWPGRPQGAPHSIPRK